MKAVLLLAGVSAAVRCVAQDVIAQMFGWNWNSLAQECSQFLGPAEGYAYIQISPPQETIPGDQWWTDYQPVSYILQGKYGDRGSLAAMIDACHKAGIKVLVDSVINNMAGPSNGQGTAGSSYSQFNYPGLYSPSSFHRCGLEKGDNIVNYTSRAEVQTCQLSDLADLDTGKTSVRATIATYLSDLLSLGVDGLRIDAAKHIAAAEISMILQNMTASPQFIKQEVMVNVGEPILPSEYVGNGEVEEFRYPAALRDTFSSTGLAVLLDTISGPGWLASSDATVFIANHRTERDGSTLKYNSTGNAYILAHVFMLAHTYGTPTVLSSFAFGQYDDGAPSGGFGSCDASSSWLCQHRAPAIAGLVAFRTAVNGDVGNVQRGSANQLAFSRGSTGFVAINNEDVAWSGSLQTSLAQGNYCNVYEGTRNSTGHCAGSFITVNGQGVAELNIPSRAAVAIYVGAEAPPEALAEQARRSGLKSGVIAAIVVPIIVLLAVIVAGIFWLIRRRRRRRREKPQFSPITVYAPAVTSERAAAAPIHSKVPSSADQSRNRASSNVESDSSGLHERIASLQNRLRAVEGDMSNARFRETVVLAALQDRLHPGGEGTMNETLPGYDSLSGTRVH